MNISQLCESLDVDVETGIEILQLFYDTAQNDLATMKAAFGSNSPKLLMEAAHSVKGAAGNMGFKEIGDIAMKLEMQGKDGSCTGVESLFESITVKIDNIGRSLRQNNGDDIDV